MRILYLSCHSILEHDEVKLLTELGHEVFSLQGAYQNGYGDGKRPPISVSPNAHLSDVAIQCSKENLHPELIDWAEVIIVMHRPDWIYLNWEKMKHKRVIWRTIGQSVKDNEMSLILQRSQGLQIVRYSPREDRIPGFLGTDSLIRFAKDPNEYSGWVGDTNAVLTVSQSMLKRAGWCSYDIFSKSTEGHARHLYGSPSLNNDGSIMPDPLWCGQLSYEELKHAYRSHRVYFYTGTYPASYTLNFIEAMMTGIPIVAIGPEMWNKGDFPNHDMYEVHLILGSEFEAGYWADSIPEIKKHVQRLMTDDEECARVSANARLKAIELFGVENIKQKWKEFL